VSIVECTKCIFERLGWLLLVADGGRGGRLGLGGGTGGRLGDDRVESDMAVSAGPVKGAVAWA
jgi:hypothetical protein